MFLNWFLTFAMAPEGNKKQSDAHELKLHPLDEEEFIGTIDIEENPEAKKQNAVQTVIILDTSGSMEDAARRVANEILPLFLSKLSYNPSQVVHLIEFETAAYLHSVTAQRMKTLLIEADGGSALAPAVKKCLEVFKKLSKNPVRLLTISDGEVLDLPETQRAAGDFVEFLKTRSFAINSQSVRLFTSIDQPDTSALCSLLQVNNTTTSKLIDISTSESNETIATKMANLFISDNLTDDQSLTTESKIIFKFPWQSSPTSELTLIPGENLFWFKGLLPNAIKIGAADVKVLMQAPLNLAKFQALMEGNKMFYIVDHMKILKIVGTEEANRSVKKIVQYFQEKENMLALKSPLVRFFKIDSMRRKKVSNFLALIEKDDVKLFDSAEKAEYLRTADHRNQNITWAERVAELGVGVDTAKKTFAILLISLIAVVFYTVLT